jgi:N-carbamoylputrescine amidase
MTFYGRSFITDNTGKILQEADRETPSILVETFDLDKLQQQRVFWGVYRDRRPSLYSPLLSFDGSSPHHK